MQISKFTSIKGFEAFCWEKWWSSEAPDVVGISQQFWKYSFTETRVLVVVFHKTHCKAATFILIPFQCHWGPAGLLENSCHGTSLGQSCRIRISPWTVGKMGLEGWYSLLRGTLSGSCITRSSGLWEKTFFSPEAFPFLCVCNVHWMEGRKKHGRSGVGKTLGEKCREILTNHGECHEKCHGITHIWRGCKITPSDWKSLQSKLFVTLSGLLVASRKEKLCPVSLQLPREGTKRRNNGKKKKSPKVNWTSANLGQGGLEFGVKAQALPLCRQLCPSLAISLCLLLITGNQTDLLVGSLMGHPSAAKRGCSAPRTSDKLGSECRLDF